MTDQELQALVDSYKVDRQGWGVGAWDGEPDAVFFIIEGFRCLLTRSSTSGSWCGYVAVDPTHPWYKLDYNAIQADVHGGLTYSNHNMFRVEADFDRWWVGFDCSHAGDLAPGHAARMGGIFAVSGNTYCDLNYARGQVAGLVRQAHNAAEPLDIDHEIAALEKVIEQ